MRPKKYKYVNRVQTKGVVRNYFRPPIPRIDIRSKASPWSFPDWHVMSARTLSKWRHEPGSGGMLS